MIKIERGKEGDREGEKERFLQLRADSFVYPPNQKKKAICLTYLITTLTSKNVGQLKSLSHSILLGDIIKDEVCFLHL